MPVPTSPLDILRKAIYLFQKTSYSPYGTFLFRTKPIFALNTCAEQQALVSTTYLVEDTFHTRSDTNVECLLTARPWAERGSCFTRGFFFFFFGSFVGDQTQTSLGHTSNDATYGVSSCKEYIENLWG